MERVKFVFFFALLISRISFPQELQFFLGEEKIKSLSLKDLKKISKIKDIKLKYHFSKSSIKNYRALELAPLLKSIYLERLNDSEYTEVIFEATDGYKAFSLLSVLLNDGGHIAFKDLDRKFDWEPVGRKMVSPAPYFLVWEREKQTTANGYPWPWALAKISIIKFQQRYPKVFPRGKKKDSAVFKGYEIFRSQCFRCHAIDNQGGKIGPDLGAPQNILSYRKEKFVRQFIQNPERFRYSKMPPHGHLSKRDIDHLILYLKSRKSIKKNNK